MLDMDAPHWTGEPGAIDSDYDEGGVCFEDDYRDYDPDAEAADEAYERWLERIA